MAASPATDGAGGVGCPPATGGAFAGHLPGRALAADGTFVGRLPGRVLDRRCREQASLSRLLAG
ncbi:MAG: hypothetical protein ACOX8V_03110 [Thermoleophilia bacterium]|jgi:hypothetical protein